MAATRSETRQNEMLKKTIDDLWWLSLIQGIVAVFFGLAAVFWPGLTLRALVYLFSAFVLAWGIVEIINGFLSIGRRDSWWLTLLFGIAGLGIGTYLVRHPNVSFTALILIIGLTLIGRGLLDIVGAFLDKRSSTHRFLTGVIGFAALAAGVILLFQPEAGGVAFVWVLGLYALVYGALSIALAIQAREALSALNETNHKKI
ncbi:MAG TPA: DUF308 domain-containing protein [Candidatus Saccharimonadales bacterium]